MAEDSPDFTPMSQAEVAMHHAAGAAYGESATCGTKVNYKRESTAVRSARAMSALRDRALEAYPCVFCSGWHIGRAMTESERAQFSSTK